MSHVAKYNENAVIHAIRGLGPASQTDIAAATGLSVQSVSTIVRNLTVRGYIRELRTESVGRGRPRKIIDVVPEARFAIGVHVDPAVMAAVLLDLRGRVVASRSSRDVDPEHPEVAMEVAAGLIGDLIEEVRVPANRLVGVCLATPGPIDAVTGSVVDTIWLPGWAGFPLGAALGRRIGLRVPVVKDTLAAVIGENWVRARSSLEATMVFVYVGTGTGVGLSINGEPLGGYSGNAGEVGRMLVVLGANADTGQDGLDNDPVVLVETAHSRGVMSGPVPSRRDNAAIEREFRELSRLAVSGNRGAEGILREAGRRIAEMVVMTTELLDANTVVFGGPYWTLVQPWYEPAVRAALASPSARGPHPVDVSTTAMGGSVGAIGAASVVLDERYVPRAPRSRSRT